MRMRNAVLLLSLVGFSSSFKFLAYYPMFARSHLTFMGRICDVLAEAGHNVTVLSPESEPHFNSVGTKHPSINVIRLPQSVAAREYFSAGKHDASNSQSWKDENPLNMFKTFRDMADIFALQCRDTLRNHGKIIETLRHEKFDAAFTEPLDMCGFVIFEMLGIERTALTLSIASMDGTFKWSGLPDFPSYVPGLFTPFSDRMTFMERVMNTLALESMKRIFFPIMNDGIDELIKEEFDADFPKMDVLFRKPSLSFLNSDPLIEFPRPITHQVIQIGGVTVSSGASKLNETWSALFDLRPKTVLVSFGTMANAYLMPEEYKQTIREVARKFPQVTFIWKYEKPEHNISKGIDNLVETTWLPQNDFLYDRRLSLFITHGGQGSVTESTTAGVPLIVIPVLGDQKRNAQVIKRLGTGIVVEKESLERTNELEAAVRAILRDTKYEKKARFVGESIRNRPFSPNEVFVKNMEFLAQYGPLRQLDHYSVHLNFFQFYLIDVFAFFAAIAIVLFTLIFFTVRFLLRFVLAISTAKVKSE